MKLNISRIFVLAMVVVLVFSLAFAKGWRTQSVNFLDANSNLATTSATKAGNATHYSTKFELPWKVEEQLRTKSFPTAISGAVSITEIGTNSDSINCIVSMQFSEDGTNWDTAHDVTLDTLTSATTDTNATAVEHFETTSMAYAQHARLKFAGSAAAGDSVAVTAEVNMIY
jgi:hypothetical protein